jgi:dCMP deaminase
MPDRDRPSWAEIWMQTARAMAERSRCVRAQVGCVLVSQDNRVIASSYNGPPPGMTVLGDCVNWCPRAQSEGHVLEPGYTDCCASHAEMNAVARADFTQLQGGTAYVTGSVCYTCAKLLAASNVGLVVMIVRGSESYRSPKKSMQLLAECGITCTVIDDDKENARGA